jgi:hypothetical protein
MVGLTNQSTRSRCLASGPTATLLSSAASVKTEARSPRHCDRGQTLQDMDPSDLVAKLRASSTVDADKNCFHTTELFLADELRQQFLKAQSPEA